MLLSMQKMTQNTTTDGVTSTTRPLKVFEEEKASSFTTSSDGVPTLLKAAAEEKAAPSTTEPLKVFEEEKAFSFTTSSDGVPTLLKAAAEEKAAQSTTEFLNTSTASQQTSGTTGRHVV